MALLNFLHEQKVVKADGRVRCRIRTVLGPSEGERQINVIDSDMFYLKMSWTGGGHDDIMMTDRSPFGRTIPQAG